MYTCISIIIKLLLHQFRFYYKITKTSLHTKNLCDERKHIPARRTGQISIHASAFCVKIFRDSGINSACVKIQCCICQCLQCLVSFPDKSSLIKSICIHDRHMRKHSSVFFFPISKSKHSAKIKFIFMEIGIQAIASRILVIQIGVCALADCLYLFFIGCSTHNGKDLTGEHHAYIVIIFTFHPIAMIIIIAVKPRMVCPIIDPFLPVCLAVKTLCKFIYRNCHCSSTDVMTAFFCISL